MALGQAKIRYENPMLVTKIMNFNFWPQISDSYIRRFDHNGMPKVVSATPPGRTYLEAIGLWYTPK